MGTPVSRSMTTSTMAHTMNAAIAKLIVSFCNAFINLKFRFMFVKLWFSVNLYISPPKVSEKDDLGEDVMYNLFHFLKVNKIFRRL